MLFRSVIVPDVDHHDEVSLPASASSSAAGNSAVELADPNSKDAHTATNNKASEELADPN